MKNEIRIITGALLTLAVVACDASETTDSTFKPPTEGIGEVVGSVMYADGRPRGNAEILVTRCESPIGGLGGQGATDPAGDFAVTVELPPYVPLADFTRELHCTVVAARGFARAPVDVIFTAPNAERVPVRVDLVEDTTGTDR
jgi:hypothetical protein